MKKKLFNFGKISCRVPQGSILETHLFLIYVNGKPQAVESNLLLMIHVLCTNIKAAKIEKILQKDFENIRD